ncbi:MAG: TrkA family potassium uptake protein, partial [Defluviitaleaceae bacterium]|nr:TrkA family potassium uptake protein [Defluviitaleaceae bacterium]
MKQTKSYLVIGMGRFGKSIATELYSMKHEVMVIDEHEKDVTPIMNGVTDSVIGDAKDEAVLRSLGIQNFDCVIIAIAKQEDSILINMMVKEMGAKSIISKAQNELHAKILSLIGVDRIVRPEYEMGKQ